MMASVVISSIRSALNAVERFDDFRNYPGITMKYQLKNLQLFVLCARKLGNDDGKVSTLASLFQRIHDALPYIWNMKIYDDFKGAIAKFIKEIGGWYNTLLLSMPQSTFEEVTEILYAVLEHLHGLLHYYPGYVFDLLPAMEAMIENITFLKNFICFATLRSVELRQLDNLLVQIRAVAVYAARISYMYIFQEYYGEPNVPVLLQTMKMVDPQVDEKYAEILTSSKLSTQLHPPKQDEDHDPSVVMMDFIDSLLWDLWEKLHAETPFVISTNSELQLVYEGLRMLRIMLKEQPNKFDEKIGELTRVVICDAGIIIFSLYHRDMGIAVPALGLLHRISRITQIVKGKDLSIPDLLQRIHHAREQVEGMDLPRTNELGFIDFVLENLLGMTSSKACYGLQSQFRMIHDELSSLRYSLGKIEGLRNEQKDLEGLWNAGVKVAHRVEFFIDQFVFGDFQGSSTTSFDSTLEDILGEVKSLKSKFHPAPNIKMKEVSMTPNPVPSQKRAPVADEIVGFDDDITSIIDRLTRGSKQLKMVAIVGMPGTGKTTLATKVFNHPSVTFHFHVRLWCCVSQLFHKKNLLLELLNLVVPNTNIAMSEEDLTQKLWRHLKRKRYLIFLDDVWDIEAWDSLKTSFPDDYYESRILVTSRHRVAVPQAMLDEEPHFLHPLTEDQSWELLQKKLSPRNDWSLALYELGKQIAANCKGLPLTVVVVAGLLANTEPQGWKIFLESISSVSVADHCMNTLELSYKHLPGHLKQCFLYFGLFPEDREVPVKRLIRLWIAEGFILKTESKSLEDVGRDYIMNLVGRSLVIVSKERSRGGIKACRIHDLLHEFCRSKAEQENFFHLLKDYDELLSFEEPGYMRRLCVHSEENHFKNLRLFRPRLHSLLFFAHHSRGSYQHNISFIIPRCSRLRVLDIDRYHLSFRIGIPSEIGVFLQLKYLSIWADISNIPSSIGSLVNLETFIFDSNGVSASLPDTFWNLQKLRHVAVRRGFRFASENLEKFPELCELQSCSYAIIRPSESIERLVRKFPNIRKLRCDLNWGNSNEIEIFIPDSLSQLESLHLCSRHRLRFDFPGNLRKLTLMDSLLHQSDVSRIGKLPHLEVLKFLSVKFHENTWDMIEGEFSTLRFLKLSYSRIIRWTASDDQFPCLQKLVLRYCRNLEEIPYCFESIDYLEMVEVFDCCDTVNNFFKGIQDEQMELGNSFLKIQISNDDSEDE